jgi:hypothetical protein
MASSIDEEWSMFLQNQGLCMYSEKEDLRDSSPKRSNIHFPTNSFGRSSERNIDEKTRSVSKENLQSPPPSQMDTVKKQKYTKKSIIARTSDEKMNRLSKDSFTDTHIHRFDGGSTEAKPVDSPEDDRISSPDNSFSSERSVDEKMNTASMKTTETLKESLLLPPPPICEDLHISTKTKVLFFNQSVDIQNVFWKIPIIEYWKPEEGVIKKQIKIVCKTPEESEEYKEKLKTINYYREHIIKQVDNPTARVLKYKDERKITIGISKKDIVNLRGKIKNAFYNCFVIIIRFKYEDVFREIHVKVFNTGKMEVPGVFNREQLDIVKNKIMTIIEPLLHTFHSPVHSIDRFGEGSVEKMKNKFFGMECRKIENENFSTFHSEKFIFGFGRASTKTVNFEKNEQSPLQGTHVHTVAQKELYGVEDARKSTVLTEVLSNPTINLSEQNAKKCISSSVRNEDDKEFSGERPQMLVGKLEIIEPIADENVLINSNFNCGYYIDREKLHNILNSKYGIECSYDPCSYPGVKCKYYFNNRCGFNEDEQDGQISNEDRKMKMSELGDYKKYTEVSFMIFRTGSCLIVGNCSENILRFIFNFLKKILYDEYPNISIINENNSIKEKKVKQKKKKIIMTPSYFDKIQNR